MNTRWLPSRAFVTRTGDDNPETNGWSVTAGPVCDRTTNVTEDAATMAAMQINSTYPKSFMILSNTLNSGPWNKPKAVIGRSQ